MTELVEKGEKDFAEEDQLIEDLTDLEANGEVISGDEVSLDREEVFDQTEEDLDFSDISLESELGLEQASEEDEGSIEEETAGDDLDKILEEGIDQELDIAPEESVEESLEEVIEEKVSEEPETHVGPKTSEEEEVPVKLPHEGMIGISEEKIEAIVTRVIEDVVERNFVSVLINNFKFIANC